MAQLVKNLHCRRPRFDPWVGKRDIQSMRSHLEILALLAIKIFTLKNISQASILLFIPA